MGTDTGEYSTALDRRKMQNRIAQSKHRTKLRARMAALEQMNVFLLTKGETQPYPSNGEGLCCNDNRAACNLHYYGHDEEQPPAQWPETNGGHNQFINNLPGEVPLKSFPNLIRENTGECSVPLPAASQSTVLENPSERSLIDVTSPDCMFSTIVDSIAAEPWRSASNPVVSMQNQLSYSPLFSTTLGTEAPLHVAVTKSQIRTVQLLLENNADVNAENSLGTTALHICAKKGCQQSIAITRLLVDAGANIDAQDVLNQTPLLLAIREGNETMAENLMLLGANVNSVH